MENQSINWSNIGNRAYLRSWFENWLAVNKAVALTWGNGFIFGSDKPQINEFIRKFKKYNELDKFFRKWEYALSTGGRAPLWFEKTFLNKDIKLRFGNPKFPIWEDTSGEYVTSIWCVELRNRGISKPSNLLRSVRLSMRAIEYSVGFFDASSLASPRFVDVDSYTLYKVKPFVDMLNIDQYNYNIISSSFKLPDTQNITGEDYCLLNEALLKIREDILISQNRMVIEDDFKLSDDMDEKTREVLNNTILRKSTWSKILGGNDGRTEFLKGSPNNTLLWLNFDKVMNYLCFKAGYSFSITAKEYSTATEQHYGREYDQVTTEIKRKMRSEAFKEIFSNILIELDLWDGKEEAPFYFEINDHLIIDKDKTLERYIRMEQAGYITHTEIIEKLKNKTPEEAIEYMKKVDKEYEKYTMKFSGQSQLTNQEEAVLNPSDKTKAKQRQERPLNEK